jgi:decaprenylphospho-beta-D-ribofuranose 2-oxidase
MAISGMQARLTNWTKSASSPCIIYKPASAAEISAALAAARAQHLSVIAHGAGHSYTDASLNTNGVVIDTTPMRRILAWDPASGIMRVEPGVTMGQIVQTAWTDGWWPFVSPSTPAVTMGGCAAMNVNGKNAWKYGPFGAHILSLDVLLTSGVTLTLTPKHDAELFYAFVGSMGLLGIITSITLQLQRITSGYVTVRRVPTVSLGETLSMFAEEEGKSEFMEAWLDGFAAGDHLGRGILTSASLSDSGGLAPYPSNSSSLFERVEMPLARLAASLGRPLLLPGTRLVNRANYLWARLDHKNVRQQALYPYMYWPEVILGGYQAMLPQGAETFQAFVPKQQAKEIFTQVLHYSQAQGCLPLWCVIKQHRTDPFLLSYQLDGFSLELNYPRTAQTADKLQRVLQHMIATVIEAGGRFYLAKDHFLTRSQYRQSVGDEAIDAFLLLKGRYDPETLLQSDLFRRLFQPSHSKE